MSELIRHVASSISAASGAHAEAARRVVAAAGVPMLERLAMRLAGAQHTPRPRSARRTLVVVAADHPAADPGIALGASHPTVVAAHAIADGSGALAHVARASRVPIVLVDAGVAEVAAMPPSAVALGPGARTLTPAATATAIEAGIALAMSLADDGLDLLALGAIGLGWDLDGGAGPQVLAGLILGAASINVPVILDNVATSTAARIAATYNAAVIDSLIAAHAGSPSHSTVLHAFGLEPLFTVGLGHGDGTGAAMAIPLADQVAALVDRSV